MLVHRSRIAHRDVPATAIISSAAVFKREALLHIPNTSATLDGQFVK